MTRTRQRFVLAALALTIFPQVAQAIPAWARKYSMNCSGCHTPVVPRLNELGLLFKWSQYRMPQEIGDKLLVKRIEEYIAARGAVEYGFSKTDGSPPDADGVSVPSASIFAAGAIGTNVGGFFEFERGPEGTVDLMANIGAVWGGEQDHFGIRAGQGHMLVEGAVAGFDRAIGLTLPLALSDPTSTGNPFVVASDGPGVEAWWVLAAKNRFAVQLMNRQAPMMGGSEGQANVGRDISVTDQFIWGKDGDGLTALAYFGNAVGLDSARQDAVSQFTRFGLSANKYIDQLEMAGGVILSRESGLPSSAGGAFQSPTQNGLSYWASGQYSLPKSHWTLFGRYEWVDPNRDDSSDGLNRIVVGSVVPVNLPEYVRLTVEYVHDSPQAATARKRQGLTLQAALAF